MHSGFCEDETPARHEHAGKCPSRVFKFSTSYPSWGCSCCDSVDGEPTGTMGEYNRYWGVFKYAMGERVAAVR